jgi:hypothetical protein
MMNEIKRGHYSVEMHNLKLDFSGVYTSLTIRMHIKTWLKENYEIHKEEYMRKYKLKNFNHGLRFITPEYAKYTEYADVIK